MLDVSMYHQICHTLLLSNGETEILIPAESVIITPRNITFYIIHQIYEFYSVTLYGSNNLDISTVLKLTTVFNQQNF